MSDRLRALLDLLKAARDVVHEVETMIAAETEAPEEIEDGADPAEEQPEEEQAAEEQPAAPLAPPSTINDRQLARARAAVARVNGAR